jgi:hypothetical protein
MRNKILSCINKAGYSHAGGVCLESLREYVEDQYKFFGRAKDANRA